METETKRKLASIQRVDSVYDHPDYPRISGLAVARIQGWNVIVWAKTVEDPSKPLDDPRLVRQYEVYPGDIVVYIEIDAKISVNEQTLSWIPDGVKKRIEKQKDQSEFIVKTANICKFISQGLLIPLNMFGDAFVNCEIGTDVTEQLNIEKYDPPEIDDPSAITTGLQPFPKHIVKKTDEARVQSNRDLLEFAMGKPFEATLKLDGTSCTFVMDVPQPSGQSEVPPSQTLLVCGRNTILPQSDKCFYWEIARRYNIEKLLCGQLKGYAIQGELCGPKIQKNLLGLKENDFFVFNLVDLQTQRRLSHVAMTKMLEGTGLKTVPLWESGNAFAYSSDECLQRAVGLYDGTKNQREGLIFRTIIEGTVCSSFKAVSNKYLDAKK